MFSSSFMTSITPQGYRRYTSISSLQRRQSRGSPRRLSTWGRGGFSGGFPTFRPAAASPFSCTPRL
ncbi:uncharacterized protein K444DRAFT_28099 [Hyaloscypha bicolor E]|uniref:Uncharacterized protein n=1 Tax=Hyaloscypha bicolor E TaxID=1095630 RepID=A0A2J6T365_9HELO|nr:uncharacterized protein K444DRAFT_28099 [Hyaloscypha bicolor E]PMD57468.1 hypothetical protein K444DRAFT_28099 [Hyaloscypha bicolor E]